ncbi:centrosome and spindle pole-associated protein 1 isoform X2 [Ambystoma mexicanum]|uniref:centrosome and spindle pole-associated protein 1 isoform X2 n=1 Tax=Ambystoma mexicanum TaxID=8296 RepID=UPI0037E76DED
MGEDLDLFIEEQKAKLAHDKADLEKDTPYIELKSPVAETLSDAERKMLSMVKENISPYVHYGGEGKQTSQHLEEDFGLSLPLGEEYERKKNKLKEELRQDYRKYLNQKHNPLTSEVDSVTQGMSLPIWERLSAKERLRYERNKEYNQFLREKEDANGKFRLIAIQNMQNDRRVNSEVKPESYKQIQTSQKGHPPRKDASTSMEAYEELLNRKRQEEGRYRRLDDEIEIKDERRHRRSENEPESFSRSHQRRESELDVLTRPRRFPEDHDFNGLPPAIHLDLYPSENLPPISRHERDFKERIPTRLHNVAERVMPLQKERIRDYDYRHVPTAYVPTQGNENRAPREWQVRNAPAEYEDDFHERSVRRPISAAAKTRAQASQRISMTERSKSATDKEEGSFATGLLLGGPDKGPAQQRKKEQYRHDLMEQIAEQQRNRKREKELELKVAASGAIDPEKQPDRLKVFGAQTRQHDVPERNVPYRSTKDFGHINSGVTREERPFIEERMPPEKPRVAFQHPASDGPVLGNTYGAAAVSSMNDNYYRGLSNTLGEMVAPRIVAVPPPPLPALAENYRTPYDDAYYFYGARNPLDPSLAYYNPGMMGVHPAPFVQVPVRQVVQPHSSDNTVRFNENKNPEVGASLGLFPEERPKQSKEAVQFYQGELQKQIMEKNERRRKAKEEAEHYDAKLEADMKNYNPWGKGGGGAPLKDGHGNLITDLNRMHRQNEDAYQNPEAKSHDDRRALVSVDLSLATPRVENTGAPTNKIAGFTFAKNSPFARGKVFAEPASEQQVQQQESYKDFLRLQIEEKRRKDEEEREKIRLEEEKEERRIAEQREKIQKEYEEEITNKKKKEDEQKLKNEELIRLAEERRKEAERKRKEEEEKQDAKLQRYYEQETRTARLEMEEKPRQPSPMIPALQKKLSARIQRPPTSERRLSTPAQEQPKSRSQSPPVPARKNQLRANEDKKNVISELSELRKQLRSEQRRLEGRLLNADEEDELSMTGMSSRKKEMNTVDVFDMARLRMQAPVRRPSMKTDTINVQNIREFNDLKYRDTETREDVRQMYPDPPKDDQTLDIQQQALLREQQRKLNRMKKGIPEVEYDGSLNHAINHPEKGTFRNRPTDLLRTSLLESESAFIGENGEAFPVLAELYPSSQLPPSARDRRRHKKNIDKDDNDNARIQPTDQPDNFSLQSISSLNVNHLRVRNEERLRRLNNLDKRSPSIAADVSSLGDADDLLKHFQRSDEARPQSGDTVATDPWMRPGTSDTLKRFIAGQSSQDKLSSATPLPFNWQGLSTAHG